MEKKSSNLCLGGSRGRENEWYRTEVCIAVPKAQLRDWPYECHYGKLGSILEAISGV